MRWSVALIVVAICQNWAQVPKQRSQWYLGLAASLGANYHRASFGQLPGIPSCCTRYSPQWNVGWGIDAIAEHEVFFPISLAFQMRVGYTSLGGVLEREEFIANVIQGDRRVAGISRYRLQAQLDAVSLQPLLRVGPFAQLPIAFDIGARVDWIFTARYHQYEELMSPSEGAVFETGTRRRNEYSGMLPTAATIGVALSAGAGYAVKLSPEWTLRPELRLQLGLTSVADVPWTVHRITAGIVVLRRQTAQSPPPPLPLPPPSPSEPPPVQVPQRQPVQVVVERQVLGAHRQLGDTAIVELPARLVRNRSLLLPVILFAPQSAELDSQALQRIRRLAQSARQKRLVVELAPSTAPDEHDSLRLARLQAVRQILLGEGVIVRSAPVPLPTPRNAAAVIDELRSVWLMAPGAFVEESNTVVINAEPSLALLLTVKAEPVHEKVTLNLKVEQDGKEIVQSGTNTQFHVQLSPSAVLRGSRSFYSYSVDVHAAGGEHVEQKGMGVLIPELIVRDTVYSGESGSEWLTLGYCNFDSPVLSHLDSAVVRLVREAVAKGHYIELVALTDSLGTQQYNTLLAQRRAEAALTALGVPAPSVHIGYRIGGFGSNGSLYSRLANRGVIVRFAGPRKP